MFKLILFNGLALLLLICFCDCYNFQTKYLDVPLDHFSFTNNNTFKLRYLVNDKYWTDGGPIFFYTGNEGDVYSFANNTGFMMDIAPKFGALIVFAEHRYYGTSLPFGNLSYSSPKYLGYLSSEQALEDFVYVINYFQHSTYAESGKLPVVAFGGSYGGMLAAWLRMKYPHAVAGAIAASAPVWQFPGLTSCGIFNRILTRVFKLSNKTFDCSLPIRKMWTAIRNITKTSDGKQWFSANWKLCNKINDDNDVNGLIEQLVDILGNLAMVNYPYPSNFLAPLPGNPVKAFCEQLAGKKFGNDKMLLNAMSKAFNVYMNYTGTSTCNNFKNPDPMGDIGWDFQTCTEMVMPMCSTDDDMFENSAWDFNKFSNDCIKKFGVKPLRSDVAILKYGGKQIQSYSNIVFSNGLLDPWSGGGVLSNVSNEILAIVIPEGAHHLDLRSADPNDPASVKYARQFHIKSIKKWLLNFYGGDSINLRNSFSILGSI